MQFCSVRRADGGQLLVLLSGGGWGGVHCLGGVGGMVGAVGGVLGGCHQIYFHVITRPA